MTDYLIENLLKEKISDLFKEYSAVKSWALEMWSVGQALTFSMDHGPGHSRKVLGYMNDILYQELTNRPNGLKDIELYLLCVSAWLHDIGMQVEFRDGAFAPISKGLSFTEQKAIRAAHAKKSEEVIEALQRHAPFAENGMLICTKAYNKTLRLLCGAHRGSRPEEISGRINKEKLHSIASNIRLGPLVGMLQFADAVHMSKDRVLDSSVEKMYLSGQYTGNELHYLEQQYFNCLYIDDISVHVDAVGLIDVKLHCSCGADDEQEVIEQQMNTYWGRMQRRHLDSIAKIKEALGNYRYSPDIGWGLPDPKKSAFPAYLRLGEDAVVERVFDAYIKAALQEHRHLQTHGFETTLRIPIELKNVFINMRAYVHGRDFEYSLSGMKKMQERLEQEKLEVLDIKAAFKVADRRRIKDMVVLGKPGSGKTTLLKYILLSIIERQAGERLGLSSSLIPFFAPLRELKDPDSESLAAFIVRVCRLGDYFISVEDLEKLLKDGKGLILLDGLDEVAHEEARIRTCRWIDRERKKYPDTRFVITSRYAGYTQKSRLEGAALELSIQDFTLEEAREFLLRWFEAVEIALHHERPEEESAKSGREKAVPLFERISASEHLKKLAVTPLLLQIIALVHRDRGRLPQRRVELYEECTNVLLEKWDAAKGLDTFISAREARQILQPLALWLHEEEERRSAPLNEIADVIRGPLEEIGKSDVDPEKLLLNIRDRSGIFMGYNETEYGFTHLSFQEYLAAEQVRNKGLIEMLVLRYGHRWWKEVTLLCLALNNPSVIEEFVERLVKTERFKSDIGLIMDAIGDSIIKPSKLLSAAASDDTLSPEARDNAVRLLVHIGGEVVISKLKDMAHSEDKALASAGYSGLIRLGSPELVAQIPEETLPTRLVLEKDKSQMVLVPAGSFLYGSLEDDELAHSDEKPQRTVDLPAFYMDVFPVTNRQYCDFLKERKPNASDIQKWINIKRSRIIRTIGSYYIEGKYADHPVTGVSWYGAAEYAAWAGKRLPTEQEREKAARGPHGLIYPWGDEFDSSRCNTRESGNNGTTEVDKYHQGVSWYGCYDMAGNVWEWTSSNYNEQTKTLRGGSWLVNHGTARCADRIRDDPDNWYNDVGFRCARTFTL